MRLMENLTIGLQSYCTDQLIKAQNTCCIELMNSLILCFRVQATWGPYAKKNWGCVTD